VISTEPCREPVSLKAAPGTQETRHKTSVRQSSPHPTSSPGEEQQIAGHKQELRHEADHPATSASFTLGNPPSEIR